MLKAVNKLVQLFAGLEAPSMAVSTRQVDEGALCVSLEALHMRSRQVNTLLLQQIEHLQMFTNGKTALMWLNSSNEKQGSDREAGFRSWDSGPGQSRPLAPAAVEKNR